MYHGCSLVAATPLSRIKIMTDTEILEIKSHTNNNTQKWNMLLAQQDRSKLIAEVERLREKLKSYNEDI